MMRVDSWKMSKAERKCSEQYCSFLDVRFSPIRFEMVWMTRGFQQTNTGPYRMSRIWGVVRTEFGILESEDRGKPPNLHQAET